MQTNLKDFFNYQPIFEQKDIDEFFKKEVKQKVIDYIWEQAWEKIQKAYDFALKAHGDEKRLSWEPYIVHPVYVAKYLLMIKPWVPALQAALLHDVIEDTDVTWDDILKEFWPEVAFLCLGLEKVSTVRYHWEDRQVETLKKTFLAMGRDIRVIFVKLADRMHNIQTLKYHPKKEKQERIAQETIKIYAPLAKRLWIEVFQTYLENGAFAVLNPEEFKRISNYLDKYYSQVNVDELLSNIAQLLKDNNIGYIFISWRIKTPYRIYLKFLKYDTYDLNVIKDILAFRIVVKDISLCYKILGVVHSKYTPIIKKIKDYISLPKPNGYQSLHTTILWLYKEPVEIQIRTSKMNDFAEYWVAAHFIYKESGNSLPVNSKQVEWINKLKDMVQEYQEVWSENHWFFNVLDIDFLRQSVFVYTPKGKIIELPKWSTVLDFAFKIHTDIWCKLKSAIVNGKIVSIDYKLKNWDIIEIKTFKNKYVVNQSWLDYVISPISKSKIRSFLNKQERDKQIQISLEYLNKELSQYNLPKVFSKDDKIVQYYWEKKLESILIQIFNKNLSVWKIIKQVYNITGKKDEQKPIKDTKPILNEVIIDNSPLYKYSFCPECKPTINDNIIWKVTKEWIKIHSTKCKALKSVNFEKLIEAHWKNQEKQYYNVVFNFDISWKLENVVSILNLIQGLNVKVLNINTFQDNDKDFLNVKVSIKLPTTLHLINQKLKKEWKKLFNKYEISFI